MGFSLTEMVPAFGGSRPLIMRKMVLLPQPLTPTMQWNDPGSTEKDRPSMMSKSSPGYW